MPRHEGTRLSISFPDCAAQAWGGCWGTLETLLLGAQPSLPGQAQVRIPAAAPGPEGSPQGLEKNRQTLTSGSCGFVISGPCLQ